MKIFNFLKNFSALEIYTDGSSKDGIGSWAYIVSRRGKNIVEKSGRFRRATSNNMEFHAAIEALNSIPENSKVTLFSDSKILVDAMKSGLGPRAFASQLKILQQLNQKHSIDWNWVKAHNGNLLNERCDELCTMARSQVRT